MIFRKKSKLIEADRWFPGYKVKGVVPLNTVKDFFSINEDTFKNTSKEKLGYINGKVVYPGDWVVRFPKGIDVVEDATFLKEYEQACPFCIDIHNCNHPL